MTIPRERFPFSPPLVGRPVHQFKALDTIKQSEINEVKALAKPPIGVKIVCEAVCVMLGIKPVRIPDPDDPSKRIMDFWGPSQKMLGEADFIAQLKG